MKAVRLPLLLWCAALLSLGQAAGQGPKPADSGLTGRIEVVEHKHSFTVRFYLKNTGKEEVKVVTGYGGGGLSVVPRFQVGITAVTPPTYLHPPRRSMRPTFKAIPAGKEVLYGAFTMGYPPSDKGRREKITGSIYFRDLKATIKTEARTLNVPAWKEPG